MKAIWLVLLMLAGVPAAHADRDIVYAARYYAPPGSHRASHFHIYRINPDGTGRTQLTFGAADDRSPRWSANGRQILFVEITEEAAQFSLCEINASGGKKHMLKILPSDVDEIDPAAVPRYRLDNSVVDDNSALDKHRLVDLKTGRRLVLTVPDHDGSFNSSNDILLPMPEQELVYAANDHNSTVGVEYEFFRLRPDTGALRRLAEGQFLAWSPDGSRFCVAPGRDTTPYEKRKEPYPVQDFGQTDAQYRTVWFAPLYVRAAAGGPMKQITPRLSYVTGADWRKEK